MINECVCPRCGCRMKAPAGIECSLVKCPNCGSSMSSGSGMRINTINNKK